MPSELHNVLDIDYDQDLSNPSNDLHIYKLLLRKEGTTTNVLMTVSTTTTGNLANLASTVNELNKGRIYGGYVCVTYEGASAPYNVTATYDASVCQIEDNKRWKRTTHDRDFAKEGHQPKNDGGCGKGCGDDGKHVSTDSFDIHITVTPKKAKAV